MRTDPLIEYRKYLIPIIWYRIMGLEETLYILNPNEYDDDKSYLYVLDLAKTYPRWKKEFENR